MASLAIGSQDELQRRFSGVLALLVVASLTACGSEQIEVVADCPVDIAADGSAGVDGTVDQGAADGAGTKPPSLTDQLFDTQAPLRTFDLTVADKDWQWLQAHALEETYVPATIASAGVDSVAGAVRYKGAYGSLVSCFDKQGNRTCKKLSLKVSFNETDKKGRMFGVRKLILNACNRDASCLRERLAYTLFAEAGLPAPRVVHVLVRINGGAPSVYVLVEAIDKEFIEDHFDGDEPEQTTGNLYKEAWPAGENTKAWTSALKTNESKADVSRMLAFSKAVSAASAPTLVAAVFKKAVDPWIDREAMTRYFVIDQLTHNWDGIWKFYCASETSCRNHNYYVYDDPGSGKFVVLPWDLDHTFNQPNTDMGRSWWQDGPQTCDLDHSNPLIATRAPQCDPLLAGLMRLGWPSYVSQLDTWTAAGGLLSQARLQQRLDGWRAQIYAAITADPLGPGLVVWLSATAQLRQILTVQVAEARALLLWKAPKQP